MSRCFSSNKIHFGKIKKIYLELTFKGLSNCVFKIFLAF
jgi:hypothetical protein